MFCLPTRETSGVVVPSPDLDKYIATTWRGTAYIFDTRTGEKLKKVTCPQLHGVWNNFCWVSNDLIIGLSRVAAEVDTRITRHTQSADPVVENTSSYWSWFLNSIETKSKKLPTYDAIPGERGMMSRCDIQRSICLDGCVMFLSGSSLGNSILMAGGDIEDLFKRAILWNGRVESFAVGGDFMVVIHRARNRCDAPVSLVEFVSTLEYPRIRVYDLPEKINVIPATGGDATVTYTTTVRGAVSNQGDVVLSSVNGIYLLRKGNWHRVEERIVRGRPKFLPNGKLVYNLFNNGEICISDLNGSKCDYAFNNEDIMNIYPSEDGLSVMVVTEKSGYIFDVD